MGEHVFDYVIIGSGFGGSVSAMRLTEKGYSVLVLERGKRYRDQDFAKRNWNIFKYIWMPALRCFGILQLTLFRNVLVLRGSGVGGGSLGYGNVLMQPDDQLFTDPAWKHLADWKIILQPHYDTAKWMLGVRPNPYLWVADKILKEIAHDLGTEATFQPTQVGVFFGAPNEEGKTVPDPYFAGEGPDRTTCNHCGGCMVGCRYNSKNTLVKNYLYFAEKWGAQVWENCEVRNIRPLADDQPDCARYEVVYRSSTAWLLNSSKIVRARNVIISASSLGTLQLLFRCRDIIKSLPRISQRLGDMVRTNSETLLGISSRDLKTDYSQGIAITSIFYADPLTTIEPVRYPAGSSLMRLLSGPLIETDIGIMARFLKTLAWVLIRPLDFLKAYILPGWARRTTILLVMQALDNRVKIRLGRGLLTLGKRGLVSHPDQEHPLPGQIPIGYQVTTQFARQINGIPAGSLNETLFKIPVTAHILGGCPFGLNDQEGVVDLSCQIHNYPGLYVVDGSIMPANPGVNPSLSITALAEYAMSLVPPKPGAKPREPLSPKPVL